MSTSFPSESTVLSYSLDQNSYDEAFYADGSVKEWWQPLMYSFQKLSKEQLKKEVHELQHIMRENGVTYNVYNDPNGHNRTWQLDPIPLIINEQDWDIIEFGLKQRAKLFHLMLKDIYGENQLIKNGIIPPDLVFGHQGFLLPCFGADFSNHHHLLLYAADMARGPDGRMWVINDRLQAPSGMGYALENRSAMRRVLPDMFTNYNVNKISNFFNFYRDALVSVAPNQKSNPRIVVLTPGPRNETYFEHAYLSTLSGYTLVHGEDLIVKKNCLWLKTISGLQQVDVVVRRVDDDYCDPLELRPESTLGVPGLLEVIREGNVAVVNPLGTGVLENPALLAFLPNVCKFLLNEALVFPNIATWWCGQTKEFEYVLQNFNDLVIKKIHRSNKSQTFVPSELPYAEVTKLIIDIKENPFLYVGQEKVTFSTVPAVHQLNFEKSNAVFRGFCVQNATGEFKVMHGGLTRCSTGKSSFFVSNQSGGISKDTWVLDSKESHYTMPTIKPSAPEKITHTALPSRTAENLFWVGRYAERAKSTARMLRIAIKHIYQKYKNLPNDEKEIREQLLTCLTHLTMTYPGFLNEKIKDRFSMPENEIMAVLFDKQKTGSLAFSVMSFIRSAHSIRERWSVDTWRVIDEIEQNWNTTEIKTNQNLQKIPHVLDQLITQLIAFMGINSEIMTREQGWLLLDTGRKLEASLNIISLMRSLLVCKHSDVVSYALMESFLNVNENLNNYRYQFRSYLDLQNILEMMLMDPINPGSLAFFVSRLQKNINNLPQSATDKLKEEQKLILEAFTKIRLAPIEKILVCEPGSFVRTQLDQYLSEIALLISECYNVLNKRYFAHTTYKSQIQTA